MSEFLLAYSFLLAFLLSTYGTPIVQNVAFRYNILDIPDGRLKQHREPIPYLGGLIVYFAFISPIGLLYDFSQQLLGLLFASTILLIVGLFDDLKALSPMIKFLFQIVATFILIKSGIYINLVFLPIMVNVLLSFFWILALINAFNIIDIMDGLSVTVGIISCITIFALSLYTSNSLISILSISLAGALLGFLRFNWEPARIFLGDSGSMLLGMIIGTLTIRGGYTYYNNAAYVSALWIVAIPIFDLVYVMIIRICRGKSPFFGSPDHFALRLKKRFSFSAAQTVAWIGILQVALSGVVVLNFYTFPLVTIISTIVVVLFFIGLGIFLARVKME